jgi:uncharacterized protein with HEPN domain
MQRDLCAYLQDMLDATDAIFTFSDGLSFDTFENVDIVKSAVERKFEIIGEALRQASGLYPGTMDSIPLLREVIAQRNRIAHGYFQVDALILWSSTKDDLPKFREEVQRLLKVHCQKTF